MKKIMIFLFFVMSMLCFTVTSHAEEKITVKIDNEVINFDTEPQIIKGRTFVPVRAIFEALGAEVSWDGETRTVTAVDEDERINMKIGINLMYEGNMFIVMDAAPVIVNNRTLIPARFAAEAFGNTVTWDEGTRTVYISTKIKKSAIYFNRYQNNSMSIMYPADWYVDESFINEGIIFIDNQGESDIKEGMCLISITGIDYVDSSFSDIIETRKKHLASNKNLTFENTVVNECPAMVFKYIDSEGDYVISYAIGGAKKAYIISFISDRQDSFENIYKSILSTFSLF